MNAKERRALAEKAGISAETLRTNVRRKSFNADTLMRLLLARGVSAETLSHLPQTDFSKLSKSEVIWLELGRKLNDAEKVQFAELVEYLRVRWDLKK
jgi:hypothetical protein